MDSSSIAFAQREGSARLCAHAVPLRVKHQFHIGRCHIEDALLVTPDLREGIDLSNWSISS
jgi:hypothetical protein